MLQLTAFAPEDLHKVLLTSQNMIGGGYYQHSMSRLLVRIPRKYVIDFGRLLGGGSNFTIGLISNNDMIILVDPRPLNSICKTSDLLILHL